VLIAGPVALSAPAGVELINVVSAEEMLAAAEQHFDGADLAIFSAAVADFKPAHRADHKLKKGVEVPVEAPVEVPAEAAYELELTLNPDILATLVARRNAKGAGKPYVVGFAAETSEVLAGAQAKLAAKGADLIIANDVSDPRVGFASADNCLLLVSAEGSVDTGLLPKTKLASLILDALQQKL
jgi:phosphopantothenoylcysteine decarboxylase/phosphopantothenate--cysteine ligase